MTTKTFKENFKDTTNDIRDFINVFKSTPNISEVNEHNISLLHKQVRELENATQRGYKPTDDEQARLDNAYEFLLKTGKI